MGAIIGYVIDGILKSAFGLLSSWMDKRNLLEQGAQNQVVKDQNKELSDVTKANDARSGVDTAVAADPGKLRDDDGFERH